MINTDSRSVATPAFQGKYSEAFLKMCPSVRLSWQKIKILTNKDMFEAPKDKWTRIDFGSFNGIRRTYLLRSPTGVDFTWRWRGSFPPFQRKGKSSSGEARIKLPPISAIWMLRVKPEYDTFISVDIDG